MTMSECQEIFARLSEYLDEELPEDMCERFRAHIGQCGPCVEFVESLRKSIRFTKLLQPGTEPAPPTEQELAALRAAYERLRSNLTR